MIRRNTGDQVAFELKNNVFCRVVIFSSVAALAGCASTPEPIIGAAYTQPRADLGQEGYSHARATTYMLRPSDQISVNVFREPDLSISDVRLGVDGLVSLPMLGSIPAAGMTTKQFEEDVSRRLLAAGLRTPMVSVNISEYASHLVTVDGAVTEPGVYAFQPGARLSSAIAMAKGPKDIAKEEQIAVFRESPEGIMIAKFDYRQVSQGTMLDPILQPGDRIVMGTDGLSVFYKGLLQALPAFGVFGVAALN
ncbi:MAG: polysaccharide biosynthesis/export family protein [Pseudomonadota bacterium]